MRQIGNGKGTQGWIVQSLCLRPLFSQAVEAAGGIIAPN